MIPYPQQKARRLDLKETGTLLERATPYHPYHPHCYQGRLGPSLNTLFYVGHVTGYSDCINMDHHQGMRRFLD